MGSLTAKLDLPDRLSTRRAGFVLTFLRWASGVVFVIFGAGKFVNHASEASSFRSYGLPWPDLFSGAIGVLELAGGMLLILGVATRPVAALLAGDMIGAIVVSGILRGETVSVTLAPVLLAAMLALLAFGPGPLALEGRRSVGGRWGRHSNAPPR